MLPRLPDKYNSLDFHELSFIISQLLLNYLDLYKKYRATTRETVTESLKTIFETGTSYLTGRDPVVTQIDTIVNEAIAEINTAKDFSDWYGLIAKFRGELADRAQELKNKSDESKLRATFHGLANFLIVLLLNNKHFKGKLGELDKNVRELKEHKTHCLHGRQGKGVKEARQELATTIYNLALLGDVDFIEEAIERHSLNNYKIPTPIELQSFRCSDTANHALPLYLQRGFCVWLYESLFQQEVSKISMDDFMIKSIKEGEEKLEKYRQEKLKQQNKIDSNNNSTPKVQILNGKTDLSNLVNSTSTNDNDPNTNLPNVPSKIGFLANMNGNSSTTDTANPTVPTNDLPSNLTASNRPS